ncbi:MAG: hypothetical protein ACT4P3_14405, partial [Betaproteobacteria bacterium]
MKLKHLLAAAAFLPTAAAAGEGDWGINLYGASYHFQRERARELGVDNEWTPGLGLRWRRPAAARWQWVIDAGVYRDSGRNTALVAGAGALWHAGERLRLGGAAAFLHSDTYNRGDPALAPVPLAAYELRRVTLNAAYLPKVREINEVATLALWATLWLRQSR